MESIALFGIGPHLSHAHQQWLVYKANRKQDSLCGEIQRVEIQLVVIAERRFHNELRHVVDKGIHEQRDEHRETLFEEGDDALDALPARFRCFQQRQGERKHQERSNGCHCHCNTGNPQVTRYQKE